MTYLTVKIFDSGYVRFAKGVLQEAEDKRRFANSPSAKYYHSILAVFVRHAIEDGNPD